MWNDALPRNGITNWSVFYAQQNTTTTNGWLSWMKPAGCSWIYIWAVGAGGAGGRPNNGAVTNAGTGGSSGAVTRILIPATLVPDILYVRPAAGAAPPAVNNAGGNNSVASYLSIAPNTTAQNLICTFNGSIGNVSAAATSASGIWLNVGLFTSIAGQSGSAGATSANTSGSNLAFGASGLPVTGGAGGGNGTGAGGDITGAGLMPTRSGGAGTIGGAGADGFRQGQNFAPGFKLFPLLFSGGAGGGGDANGGTAGSGGRGSWGCGGGGGGGSTSASGTSGNGGNGGDALILIGAF